MSHNLRPYIVLGLGLCLTLADTAMAASQRKLHQTGVKRIKRAQEYLDDIMEAPDTGIPTGILRDCRGIIVVRQYKAGFVIGAKGGSGLAMLKDEKTKAWSAPVFIKTGEGSIGFQIGGQSIDSIFLIMNKEGVEMLLKSKFKIGVDASAAVGPVGRDAEAKVGPGTAILVYARAKGLYAGATFEGGLLLIDGALNEAFYGEEHKDIKSILITRKVKMPKEALPLIQALRHYAGEDKAAKEKTPPDSPTPPKTETQTEKPAAKPEDKKPEKDPKQETLVKELQKLKNLHDKGLITDDEYKEMKKKLLEKNFE